MSDTTMIETAEQNKLGQAELEVLKNNIKDAIRVAEGRIVKVGQKIPVAFRKKDKGLVVILIPGAGEQDLRQATLDPENEYLLSEALAEVSGGRDMGGLTLNGVIDRTGMQGESVEDFLRQDYRRIQRQGREMMGRWVLESEAGKPFNKVLQVEINRPGKYEMEWSVTGQTNAGWLNLPMEGGVKSLT